MVRRLVGRFRRRTLGGLASSGSGAAAEVATRRVLSHRDRTGNVPVHVVWELTLACNLKCRHCGSRAGHQRAGELTTAECVDVIRQLAQLGTREISLIGGEAFIRKDWLTIIGAVRAAGIDCSMQSGAYKLSPEMIADAAAAGLQGLGISIDGPEQLHDRLRGVPGAYTAAMRALEAASQAGLAVSVNTQITAPAMPHLRDLMAAIIAAGARYWQLQLTVAMGNAVDHHELLLQPFALASLMPLIAKLHRKARRQGLSLLPGNNIGYFGPYDPLWRGQSYAYAGCAAGSNVMGLEADGTVKGCPSLPTARYTGGNVRDASLSQLWASSAALAFNRERDVDHLWGFCRECRFAASCRGGCSWTADALLGRRGNNPYCHHRVLTLARRGIRERVVKVADAPDAPFATGRFKLVEEPIPPAELRQLRLSPPD
ncbi:MAG: radical SAM protein [Alphaproteobacteria bacterium]|nr:radical SAM protein [Alphaproteobacteria bacterium]